MYRMRPTALILALAVASLAACKKDEPAPPPPPPAPAPAPAPAAPPPPPAPAPLAVADVQLANALDEAGKAIAVIDTFAPSDGIYALVHTTGAGNAALAASWTYGAERLAVHQEEHRIDTTGPNTHVFRITKEDGFPAGDYQVEISLDGNVVSSKQFKVQ